MVPSGAPTRLRMFFGILKFEDNTIVNRDGLTEVPPDNSRPLGYFVRWNCASAAVKVIEDQAHIVFINWKSATGEVSGVPRNGWARRT